MTGARVPFWLRAGFWRWTVRLLVGGLLLCLSLVTWVLISPPSVAPVRDDVQDWLSQKLDRPIAFQELSWTWRQGLKVRISGVEIGHRDFAVDRMRLGVAALPLLWGEVRLQGLDLVGLRLVLERKADGRLFAGGFYVDPERNRVFPLLARFQQFRIRDGTLVWRDRSAGREVAAVLRKWEVAITRQGKGHRLSLSGQVADGRVRVNGRLGRFEQGPGRWRGTLDLRGESLPMAPLAGYLGERGPRRLAGRADLRAGLQGGLADSLTVAGHIALEDGVVDWPRTLKTPVAGVGLATDFRWEWQPGRSNLHVSGLRLQRQGLALSGTGRLEWGAKVGPPRLDVRAGLAEASLTDLRPLLRLRPLSPELRDWLDQSLGAGKLAGGDLRLRGPLPRFPFPNGEGRFRAELGLADVNLAYHPDWPPVRGVDGTLTLDRTRLAFRADRARLLDTPVDALEVSIHDLTAEPARLRLQGRMGLELAQGVRFLEASPLLEAGSLDPASLTGPAHLDLGLELPLEKDPELEMFGRVELRGARFRARPDMPAMEGVTGGVEFSGETVDSRDLAGRLLGQRVTVELARKAGKPFRAELAGTFPVDRLRRAVTAQGVALPQAHHASGEVGVRLGADWGEQTRRVRLDVDLREAALILPEPAFKAHGDPATFTVRGDLRGQPGFSARLDQGSDHWRLRYRPGAEPALGIGVGWDETAPEPRLGEVRAAGRIPRLPLRQWLAFREGLPGGSGGGLPWRLAAEVDLDEIRWGDRSWGGGHARLRGRPGADGAGYRLSGDFRGDRLAGELGWSSAPEERNRLTATVDRLRLPDPSRWGRLDLPGGGSEGALPAVDLLLSADRLILGERVLEATRLQAQSFPGRLLLHRLETRLGRSELELQGDWLADRGSTQLRVNLDTRDFGRWLRDVGVYPSMKGGKGNLGGSLSWPGRPRDFAMGRLGGRLRLDMVEGEIEEFYFLSKALATLNVLDWPRQMVRGMKDLGSSGLVYRELRGRTRIRDGVARVEEWDLESAPLRMSVEGDVDLGARDYDLLLHLAPLQTIDKIVSSVPLVGYLLTGRERTLTSLSYRVKGPWSDPAVTGISNQEEASGGLEGFFHRLKEMQWKDLLPWR